MRVFTHGWKCRAREAKQRQRFDKAAASRRRRATQVRPNRNNTGAVVQRSFTQPESTGSWHKYFKLSRCGYDSTVPTPYVVWRTVFAYLRMFTLSPPPKTRIPPVANKSQKAVPRFAPVPLMRECDAERFFTVLNADTAVVCFYEFLNIVHNGSPGVFERLPRGKLSPVTSRTL